MIHIREFCRKVMPLGVLTKEKMANKAKLWKEDTILTCNVSCWGISPAYHREHSYMIRCYDDPVKNLCDVDLCFVWQVCDNECVGAYV